MLTSIKNRDYTKNMSSKNYYSLYTFFFLLISLFIVSIFLYRGKSFVCASSSDAIRQHLPALAYYGHYLREIIKKLIFQHTLSIPMFDMSIGYGGDILTTLSYYVIGDPFAFLSVFCPMQYIEHLFGFLIFLRLFFAGITFSMYCRYHGYCSLYTVVGSLIYVFAAYSLHGFIHPFLINPMIYIPLLFLGADKMLKNEGNLTYIVMITISALTNFYYFYIICIMVFLYTIFRFLMLFGIRKYQIFLKKIFKFIICSLLGIGIALVLFLPVSINILSSSRFSVNYYIPLFYPLSYYLQLPVKFTASSYDATNFNCMGYTPLAFISVVILFLKHKEKRDYLWLCAGFLLLVLFLLLPWFGHALNGMAYVANRWIWALAFFTALIIVQTLPLLLKLNKKQLFILFGISAFYAIYIFLSNTIRTEKHIAMLLELAVFLMAILIYYHNANKIKFPVVCLFLCTFMIQINILYMFSPTEENFVNRFADTGTSLELIKYNTPGMLLEDIGDSSLCRYDTAAIYTVSDSNDNSPLLWDKNGTSFYFSTPHKVISEFNRDMNLNTSLEQRYQHLDRRAYLDTLLGAKYFIIPTGKEANLPYGYNTLVKSEGMYSLYKSDYALPLCYTSDSYIRSDVFQSYSIPQKQQALLQGIVVNYTDYAKEIQPTFSDRKQMVTITDSDGVIVKNGSFCAIRGGGTVTLSFPGVKHSETYLLFGQLNFKGIAPYNLYTNQELKKMSSYQKRELKKQSQNYTEPNSMYISTTMGNLTNSINLRTNKNNFYCGIHDFLVNMGYSKKAQTSITLTFPAVGIYTYDNLSVVCQPMDKLYEQSVALKQDVPEKFEINNNEIYTSLSLKTNKLVCFSVPYSSGWSAIVDGQKTEILKANNFCMALELEKGSHEIILQYETPYFRIGGIISIVSTGIFLCIALFTYRKKKKWRTQV